MLRPNLDPSLVPFLRFHHRLALLIVTLCAVVHDVGAALDSPPEGGQKPTLRA